MRDGAPFTTMTGFDSGKFRYQYAFVYETIPNYIPDTTEPERSHTQGMGSKWVGNWRNKGLVQTRVPWGYYHRPDVMQRLRIARKQD